MNLVLRVVCLALVTTLTVSLAPGHTLFSTRHTRNPLNSRTQTSMRSAFLDTDVTMRPSSVFSGLRKDLARRLPLYRSDWTDGFRRKKTYAAASFLYFACLAPIVAFGGLVSSITKGQMGVIEFLISSGASGIIYALFSGQPMTFLGPTGLTLAFITTLFRFTDMYSLPFLPLYAWTGLWTSLFLFLVSAFNLSNLMKYCTRFTDDCFNSLLVINFLYEAVRSIAVNFTRAGADLVSAFASLNIALATWALTLTASKMPQSKVLNKLFRRIIGNVGPTAVILVMSTLVAHPVVKGLGIQTLQVPAKFALQGSRPWLVDLRAVSPALRMFAALPALLLTMLFYLDQNISVRAANQTTGLSKGPAYHLDMLVLAVCVGGLSLVGLPWTCAATVQTLNHIRAMSSVRVVRGKEVFSDTLETRVTGLLVHAAILSTLFLLPYMSLIPLPVISGIFLFLGQKLTANNLYLERMGHLFDERELLPPDNVFRRVSTSATAKFLGLQSCLLGLIWFLKSHRTVSLLFPGSVALLMITRQTLLPKILSTEELALLDPDE